MDRQRDANALPGRPSNDGGQRLEKEILQRTPKIALSGASINHTPTGPVISIKRQAATSSSTPCSFGRVVFNDDVTNNRAVVGGAITIGDKNFNVANYPFPAPSNGTGNGQWLVEISISGVSFNTDDDDSLVLPGIETASGTPTWAKIAYTGTENYTSNTNPSTPTGTGTVILPIGLLTVAGSSATIAATGCGAFLVDQCAGVFSSSRYGGGSFDSSALEARIAELEYIVGI